RNCGIWYDVYLSEPGPAKLSDPLVVSAVDADGRASMTPSVNLDGDLGGDVEVEGWIGDIRFSRKVTEGGQVAFPPEAFSQLRDREMRLWWPNGYGEAALYDAGFVVRVDGVMSDSLHYKAGIREVKATADDGTLRLFVNGRRISPVGGNWGFCQQNLQFSERDYDISVAYHRQMNFNMIRNWVGQIEDEEFFAACDRYGIMVWQDFWLANPDDGPDPDDEAMFVANALDNTSRIRRHPCIVLYCGRNEGNPPATLDRALRDDVVGKLHPDIPYISNSADDLVSGHGPYNVESARYYFTHQSGKLHTERGMPTVLTLESMRRFLPEEDLWPRGDMWGKHDFTTSGPQRGETYMKMMSEAFGECRSAREFSALAQWINYDGYRAIFESSLSGGRMGVLLWMSHSCWPSMMWCTYDYYFQPTGAFFGSKKGCEKLHIFYNAATGGVEVANSGAGGYVALTAEAKLYGCRGNALWSGSVTLDSPEDSGVTAFDTLEFPEGEEVYLLRLELKDAEGALLSDNFYMMGKEEGNLRALRGLRAAELKKTERRDGPNNIKVTLRNDDSVPALMVRLVLLDRSGEELLPVDYSDNYISLLPGEERTVEIGWRSDSCSEPAFVDVIQMGDFQREKDG
ncbi:MAG: beta-glycosidase, partial [Bacteroidales bacterium]|nr:beta-glycosidase [Bacteroidales bacterium]